MTVVKGLVEASTMLVIAAVVAAISALSWITIGGGDFAGRMGFCLVILGAVLAITGNSALSRMGSSDAFAWLGRGPEVGSPDAGGGRILTGIGVFLFVAVPLMAIGAMLSG
jgi:hypothetical protein